jgi:hypothetical protein
VRSRRIAAFLVAFGGASVAWYGCNVYGPDLLTTAPDGAGDGGPLDGESDAAPEDPCTTTGVKPPPPAGPDDGPGALNVDVVLAMRPSPPDAGPPPALSMLGYNLDRTCTCPGPETCKPVAGGARACDLDGGRDNAGGDVFENITQVSRGGTFSLQNLFEAPLYDGTFNILIHITEYNGQPNDSRVKFAMYLSPGTRLVDGADGGVDGGRDSGADAALDGGGPDSGAPSPTHVKPRFAGDDEWQVDEGSIIGRTDVFVPRYSTANAYVVDNVFYAQADFPFGLVPGVGLPTVVIQLRGSIVSGTLRRDANGVFTVDDGTIAGRLSGHDFLDLAKNLPDPSIDTPPRPLLCQKPQSYEFIRTFVCSKADILDRSGGSATDPCNALSFALPFRAISAKLGKASPGLQTDAGSPCDSFDSGIVTECPTK